MALLNRIDQQIILASASPRRQQLFRLIVDRFEIMESKIPEHLKPGESPEKAVQRLAFQKAAVIVAKIPEGIVIGADSLVVLNQHIFTSSPNSD